MSWPRKPDSTQQMCPQSWINREWGALLHLFHRVQNRPDFTAASTEEFFTGTIIHQKITLSSVYSMKVPLRNLSLHLGSHPSLAQPKHPTVCSLKQGSWKTADKGIPDLAWGKADVNELLDNKISSEIILAPAQVSKPAITKVLKKTGGSINHSLLPKVMDKLPESRHIKSPAPQFYAAPFK